MSSIVYSIRFVLAEQFFPSLYSCFYAVATTKSRSVAVTSVAVAVAENKIIESFSTYNSQAVANFRNRLF